MTRVLEAWINEQRVGTLHEANGLWAFEYSSQWLAHPDAYALCPGIPLVEGLQRDGATNRPVQWYFDNLLPEEGQRTLLAGSARLDAHDAFALLAYYGAESAGSVTLLAQGASQVLHATHPLPDEALSRRIRQMPSIPLTHEARKRMSLAGAQHKLAVILGPGLGVQEPDGRYSLHAHPKTRSSRLVVRPLRDKRMVRDDLGSEGKTERTRRCVPLRSATGVPDPAL